MHSHNWFRYKNTFANTRKQKYRDTVKRLVKTTINNINSFFNSILFVSFFFKLQWNYEYKYSPKSFTLSFCFEHSLLSSFYVRIFKAVDMWICRQFGANVALKMPFLTLWLKYRCIRNSIYISGPIICGCIYA